MKHGYVIPPRNKQRNAHKKQMSFATYLQLRMFLSKHGSTPSSIITNHNKDKLTYLEGYHAFHMVKQASEEDLRLISGIISLLYTKHVITKHEEMKFIKDNLRSLKNG